jgi:hypothetical protein
MRNSSLLQGEQGRQAGDDGGRHRLVQVLFRQGDEHRVQGGDGEQAVGGEGHGQVHLEQRRGAVGGGARDG